MKIHLQVCFGRSRLSTSAKNRKSGRKDCMARQPMEHLSVIATSLSECVVESSARDLYIICAEL